MTQPTDFDSSTKNEPSNDADSLSLREGRDGIRSERDIPAFVSGPEHSGDEASDAKCAECGGSISQDDLVCPHCGISLAAG